MSLVVGANDLFATVFRRIDWRGPLGFCIVPTFYGAPTLQAFCLVPEASLSDPASVDHLARTFHNLEEVFLFEVGAHYLEKGRETTDVRLSLKQPHLLQQLAEYTHYR